VAETSGGAFFQDAVLRFLMKLSSFERAVNGKMKIKVKRIFDTSSQEHSSRVLVDTPADDEGWCDLMVISPFSLMVDGLNSWCG
jgi:hypothetical protein